MHVYSIINMLMYDVALEIKMLEININSNQYWRQIKQILQLQNIIKMTSTKNYLRRM
jgi:hypothetical protein